MKVALCLLLGLAVSARTWAEQGPFPVHEELLASGDHLLVAPDDRAPLVHLELHIPLGTNSSWAWDNHAPEAWSIQDDDPEGALRARANQLAVNLRLGRGSWDTFLVVSCLSRDLPATIDLVRDVLANRDFDRAALRRRRKSQRLDWKANSKSPRFVLWQETTRLMFDPRDPRRRAFERPRDPETDIVHLAEVRDALLRVPGRTLGISGDVSLEQARQIAAALLPEPSALPEGWEPSYLPLVAPKDRAEVTEVPLPGLTQVYFAMVREGLLMTDADYPAMLVAAHVLSGHAHARLGQALRYDDGATYAVQLAGEVGIAEPAMSISTYTRVDNAQDAELRLREALELFHAQGISEQELVDAMGFLRGREAFRLQSPTGPVGQRSWELIHELPAGFRNRAIEQAGALTVAEVNDFITRFFDPETFSLIRVAPRG